MAILLNLVKVDRKIGNPFVGFARSFPEHVGLSFVYDQWFGLKMRLKLVDNIPVIHVGHF